MIRLALAHITGQRRSSIAVLVGLLSATLGLSLLGTLGAVATATLVGDVDLAWRTPYDILVRPPKSATPLELERGLVRPNFISGLNGGITPEQLDRIRLMPDVVVAAPIALVGYVEWPTAVLMPLAAIGSDRVRIYRITTEIDADGGLSHYPIETRIVINAPSGTLQLGSNSLRVGNDQVQCGVSVNCFAGVVCRDGDCVAGAFPSSDGARYYLPLLQPIAIAGIDPAAEAALTGIAACITTGRMLAPSDALTAIGDPDVPVEALPVLLSNRSFGGQTLHIKVESPASGFSGLDPQKVDRWIQVNIETHALGDLYRDYIPSVHDYLDPWPLWTTSEVQYQVLAPHHLRALTVHPGDPFSTRPLSTEYGIDPSLEIPPESRDTSFRSVTVHPDVGAPGPGSNFSSKLWNVVGQYDPTCIPGFDPLAGGGLETYSYPAVTLANGVLLPPNRSLAGYVNQPPLLLTTLEGAAWLSDPKRFAGQPGQAYISAIRVKVSGALKPTDAAYRHLQGVAQQIEILTGLRADVVKGSSPQPIQVELAGGHFGRPQVTATEGWSAKGVAVRVAAAVDVQDIALATLALALGVVLVLVTAVAVVVERRRETSVLRALGWPTAAIARLLATELLILGSGAAAITVATTVAVNLAIGARTSLPILAAAAGLPLLVALFTSVLAPKLVYGRWRPPGNAVRTRFTGRIAAAAVTELLGRPRLPIAAAVLAVAASAVVFGAIVEVGLGFQGRLDVSALGSDIAFKARPYEWAAGAVTLLIGLLTAAQVSRLAFLDQAPHLAVLLAVGWPRRAVLAFIATQSFIVGVASALFAILTVALLGAVVQHELPWPLIVSAGLLGLATPCAAAVPTLLDARRLDPSRIFRTE